MPTWSLQNGWLQTLGAIALRVPPLLTDKSALLQKGPETRIDFPMSVCTRMLTYTHTHIIHAFMLRDFSILLKRNSMWGIPGLSSRAQSNPKIIMAGSGRVKIRGREVRSSRQ